MVLTNDKNKLSSKMNDIKIKAQKQFPNAIKLGVPFYGYFKWWKYRILKWTLEEINKLEFVVFVDFLYIDQFESSSHYQLLNHKMSNFVTEFIEIWESKLKKENITFVFDEDLCLKTILENIFILYKNLMTLSSSSCFIPDVSQFYSRIKSKICKCVDFMVFPTDKAKIYFENGIQLADFITGALWQSLKNND